mmetsp:Transcript_3748/g.5692  ORF Transcript_3748/g.5692 Transcript_3748/m.5692 type:complete len:248 (+) Transcript_3748:684-1427(+)
MLVSRVAISRLSLFAWPQRIRHGHLLVGLCLCRPWAQPSGLKAILAQVLLGPFHIHMLYLSVPPGTCLQQCTVSIPWLTPPPLQFRPTPLICKPTPTWSNAMVPFPCNFRFQFPHIQCPCSFCSLLLVHSQFTLKEPAAIPPTFLYSMEATSLSQYPCLRHYTPLMSAGPICRWSHPQSPPQRIYHTPAPNTLSNSHPLHSNFLVPMSSAHRHALLFLPHPPLLVLHACVFLPLPLPLPLLMLLMTR